MEDEEDQDMQIRYKTGHQFRKVKQLIVRWRIACNST